jgi:riboflavin kinase / FMN adenylyltransferase
LNTYRLDDVPDAPAGRAVAMGTFDGVHRGHRRVIESAGAWAREHGSRASVVTFEPHPLEVLRPDDPPRLLTPTGVKALLVEQLGLDEMVVIPFTRELSAMEPEAFCRDVLSGRLDARHVSVGANFRFGHGAAGDADYLRARPEFETEVIPLIEHAGQTVSSSRIRELVAEGEVAEAAELLGAPFVIAGTVVEGAARGRELDMPTANLEVPAQVVIPAAGIYAARATLEHGEEVAAAVSIGVRPTFEEAGELKIEAHLLGFAGDLYGHTVRLAFMARLRGEERFESAEALVAQMQRDVEDVRRLVGGAKPS